jgi:phospho-N-acetylmuramoyl-pentapeptide-transferase
MSPINPLTFALTLGAIAFLLTVIWGGPFVEILRRLKIGDKNRADALSLNNVKKGTPTMGGILILVPVILMTLALNMVTLLHPQNARNGLSVLLPLFILIGYGILGGIDDWAKLSTSGEGMTSRTKLIAQIVLAAIVGLVMSIFKFSYADEIYLPLIGISIPLTPVLYVPIVVFLIVGTSNAVNFIDGLDGLAGTVTASAFLAYGIVAFLQGQIFLVQFCFIIVGTCFAFLWYNALPAQLFMGDIGALALGAVLATVAIMTGQWLLLPIIAIVPVAEMISVIIQILYFHYSGGKKFFKQSPLHNHFRLSGWSETQVVQRFWLVGILSAMVGVALALIH